MKKLIRFLSHDGLSGVSTSFGVHQNLGKRKLQLNVKDGDKLHYILTPGNLILLT